MRLPPALCCLVFFASVLLNTLAPAAPAAIVTTGSPTITTNPANAAVPTGKTATFTVKATGTAKLTYQWQISIDNGGNFTTLSNQVPFSGVTTATLTVKAVSIDANDGNEFRCVVTDGNKNTATSQPAKLSVATPVSIAAQPQAALVAVGHPAHFTVVAGGTPGFTYQWFKNTTPIANATANTYTINSVQTSDVATYYVVLTNATGTATSAKVKLTLGTAPVVTASPANATLLAGKSATFKVTATGTAPLTYAWQVSTNDGATFANLTNNSTIAGATTAALSVKNVTLGMNGYQYELIVSNNIGEFTSDPATLGVGTAPVISSPALTAGALAGGNATLMVTLSAGSGTLSYQWYKDGTLIPGATNSTLALTGVSATSAGSYTVKASNAFGSATSQPITFSVTLPANGVYVGTYAGTNGEKGKFAVLVQDGVAIALHTATNLIGTDNGNVTGGVFTPFTINPDTTFSGNTSDNSYSGTATSQSFNGTFANTGNPATDNDAGVTFTVAAAAKPSTGIVQNSAGLYSGTFSGLDGQGDGISGTVTAIVAADGTVIVVVSASNDDGNANGGSGNLTAKNAFSVTLFNGAGSAKGTLNPGNNTITGTFIGTNKSSGTIFLSRTSVAAFGEPVFIYGVDKWIDYLQNSPTAPTPSSQTATIFDSQPYNFDFMIIANPGADISGLSPAPNITIPGLGTTDLAFDSDQGQWRLGDNGFNTKAALDAAAPAGTYLLNIGNLASNLTLSFTGDNYPVIPAVTNGTWSGGNLSINARANATIQFNNFAKYSSGGFISIEIDEANIDGDGNPRDGNQIVQQQSISFLGQPAFSSYTIPANTLQPGQIYTVEIGFAVFPTIDTTSLPGATGIVIFENHTDFILQTAP
jgi:hypothetical protein